MSKPFIAIIGPGALGSSLALALSQRGFLVQELVTRDVKNARVRKLAREIKAKLTTPEQAALATDIVWLCVPDDALAELAKSLGSRNWKKKIALHASAALPANVLKPLKASGASIASAHPMMSFVRSSATSFEDVWFAMEGDRGAVSTASKIVAALGGQSFNIKEGFKPLYHAFGAFLSPFLVTMLSAAEQIGLKAGIPRKQLPQIMRPIVIRTLANYFANGGAASFSGPLVRGDIETIKKHLRAMKKLPERELYRALVREAARTLPVKRAKEILVLLRG